MDSKYRYSNILLYKIMIDFKTIDNIMYGTAWKEDRTESLVTKAITAGFRSIDTANQRRHYYEEGVGNAISKAIEGGIERESFFIQTKFTHLSGQDNRLPYNPKDKIELQVKQSFDSSLQHLNIDYIDSYILHGPSGWGVLSDDDWSTWKTMEELYNNGSVHYIGISNVNLNQLKSLYKNANVKPTFVQNRCYALSGWDRDIRNYCNEKGIKYQGFSLLTANQYRVKSVSVIAERLNKTPEQIIFKFSQVIGMIPLTGTTDENHMNLDISLDFDLNTEDVDKIIKE